MEFTCMDLRSTFKSMKKEWAQKLSGIFIAWTFVVLTLVLGLWLSREFKISKESLSNTAQLEYLQEVIKIAGLDLDDLASGLNDYQSNIEVRDDLIDQVLLDSFSNADTSKSISYKVVQMVSSDLMSNEEEDSISIVGIGISSDHRVRVKPSDSIHDLSLELSFDAESSQLNKRALLKIVPQCFISVLLLLSFYGVIYSMRKRFEEQEQNQKAQSQMISNIAHELRTPLSTVSVALEAIQNFGMSNQRDKMEAYIDTSRQQLGHLDNLVDKVIEVGCFERGEQQLDFDIHEAQMLIKEVVAIMAVAFEQQGAHLNITSDSKAGLLKGDKIHLKNALVNLLDNSLKYGANSVVLDLRETKDYIIMEVSDNGPGIPVAYRTKVFQRFFRLPTGDQHDVKGYGLGLSYVQEVVSMHRGKIELLSTEGEGTRILIKIPKHED